MAMRHANAGEVVDLQPLGDGLKEARTVAIVKTERFEAVRLIVHAEAEIDAHEVPGPIILHCLEGHVLIGLAGTTLELVAGQWVYLNGGTSHSVKGMEESSLLLTVLFPR